MPDSNVHDLVGRCRIVLTTGFGPTDTVHENPADDWDAPGPVTSFLLLRYRLQSFKVGAEVPNQPWHDVRHLIADSFSNLSLERIWARLFDLSQSLSASEPV